MEVSVTANANIARMIINLKEITINAFQFSSIRCIQQPLDVKVAIRYKLGKIAFISSTWTPVKIGIIVSK